jgi:hypothetical protein
MAIRGLISRPRRCAARLYLLLGQIISRPFCVKAKMGAEKGGWLSGGIGSLRIDVVEEELSADVILARPDMKKLANPKICQLKQ